MDPFQEFQKCLRNRKSVISKMQLIQEFWNYTKFQKTFSTEKISDPLTQSNLSLYIPGEKSYQLFWHIDSENNFRMDVEILSGSANLTYFKWDEKALEHKQVRTLTIKTKEDPVRFIIKKLSTLKYVLALCNPIGGKS